MSWPIVPISEVCLYAVDCPNRTAPVVDYETPYKMLRTTNVRGGFVDTNNLRCVTEETYIKWTRRLKPIIGDVILTREAPLGDVGRITTEENLFLGQRLFHYRADPKKLDARFLAYVLQSRQVQGWISGVGFGATVKHAKVADFLKIPIPLPPIAIQEKIGLTLASYDDLIENNRRRIALLEEAARLLFREWFVYLRFPGHEHSNIADGVPEGWRRDALANFAVVRKGRNITKETVNPGTVPVVAGGLSPAYFHDTSNAEGPVVTVSASGANSGYVNIYHSDIWASDCSYFSVSDNPQIFFLYCLLRAQQAEITTMQKGAAQPHVYPKDLERLTVLWPNEVLRSEFTQIVGRHFEQIRKLRDQISALARARDLLLPRLMDGRIEV
jgi:type I restriction enzyme, S subunit